MDSHIDIVGFEKYWRRRKPGNSTAIHYTSDVRIFFRWLQGLLPEAVTIHDIDAFIEWQLLLGRAPPGAQSAPEAFDRAALARTPGRKLLPAHFLRCGMWVLSLNPLT